MSFTLRIPFRVGPGRWFAEGEFNMAGHPMRLKHFDPFHVLLVNDLESVESGRELLARVIAGLRWVAFETSDGLTVSDQLNEIQVREQASEVLGVEMHALENEGVPSIYPADKIVRFAVVGTPGVRIDSPIDRFKDRLAEGLTANVAEGISGEKAAAAMDILSASYFETSPYAQFLTRVTVLEVLKEQNSHDTTVLELLAGCEQQLRDLVEADRIPAEVGQSLLTSIVRLRRESIGMAIRRLVGEAMGSQAARIASDLYDMRSKAVHDGIINQEAMRASLGQLTDIAAAAIRHAVLGS